MKKIKIDKTKKGFPAMWEEGGGATNTGGAQIICGEEGEPLTPIYTRISAAYPNALFIVREGYHVVRASHHRRDFTIEIFKIASIVKEQEEFYAELALVNKFDMGEWDAPLDPKFSSAVTAAEEKATCYHCRKPHYIKERVVA